MVVLITGANKGIGFQIARTFGKNSYKTVVITSRSIENGFAAVEKLMVEFPQTEFKLCQLDLVDESSRRACVDYVKSELGGIDVLVNNAGFAYKGDSTASNAEQATVSMNVNLYSTKIFTEMMEPLVKSRIVTVASMVSNFSIVKCANEVQIMLKSDTKTEQDVMDMADDFVKLAQTDNHTELYSDSKYGMSKLALRALTNVQAKKWPAKLVFSGCPGWCKSDMAGWERPPRTAEQGAQVFYWLATTQDEAVTRKSGEFFWKDDQHCPWP